MAGLKSSERALWTVEEVADLWRVHRATVWRWIREGRIEVVAVRGSYRIPQSQVTAGVAPVPKSQSAD